MIQDPSLFCLPDHPHTIAIAVSGGSDSMALVCMAQDWAQNFSPPVTIVPMIVDHKLRTHSTDEASWTHDQLSQKGLHPLIIPWHHGPVSSGIMAKARQKRYELLALACHKRGIRYLLTAHHNDDVLETVWMRQAHNSHSYGLSGLSSITKRYGVIIIRPLLCHPKSTLQDYLVTHNQQWIEDPSNANPVFFRTHARSHMNALSFSEKKTLVQDIKNRSEKRAQHEHHLAQHYPVHEKDTYLHIPWSDTFQILDPKQGAILLRSWLSFFTFQHHYTYRLCFLWHRIAQAMSDQSFKTTGIIAHGGGCLFFKQKRDLFVLREKGRLPPMEQKNTHHVWDSRWFCYGTPPEPPCAHATGTLKEFLITSTIPSNRTYPSILYHPCGYSFPSFTTHVPWGMDQMVFSSKAS